MRKTENEAIIAEEFTGHEWLLETEKMKRKFPNMIGDYLEIINGLYKRRLYHEGKNQDQFQRISEQIEIMEGLLKIIAYQNSRIKDIISLYRETAEFNHQLIKG